MFEIYYMNELTGSIHTSKLRAVVSAITDCVYYHDLRFVKELSIKTIAINLK